MATKIDKNQRESTRLCGAKMDLATDIVIDEMTEMTVWSADGHCDRRKLLIFSEILGPLSIVRVNFVSAHRLSAVSILFLLAVCRQATL